MNTIKKLKKKSAKLIKENTPYKSETDANYSHLAELDIYLMSYVGLGEPIRLMKEAEKLYDKALELLPSNFNATIGEANSIAYIWLSQAFFELKSEDKHKNYIEKVKNIFTNGGFLIVAEELNKKNKSLS